MNDFEITNDGWYDCVYTEGKMELRFIAKDIGEANAFIRLAANNNCQDEPRLIATTPEEADEILAMWEAGR